MVSLLLSRWDFHPHHHAGFYRRTQRRAKRVRCNALLGRYLQGLPRCLTNFARGRRGSAGVPRASTAPIGGQSNAVRHPQCRSGTCLEGSDAPRHDFASALPDAARRERCLPKGDLADGDAPRYGPERRDGAPSRRACRLAREPNHSLVVLFHGGDDTAKVDETETVPGCDDRATRETSQQAKRPNDTKFSGERSESAATRC